MITALIVDDEKIIRAGLKKMLSDICPEIDGIYEAENGADALELSRNFSPDIAIVDIRMPKMTGLEYAAAVREMGLKTRIIVLSGYADFEYAREAIECGCCAYLLKPVKISELSELMKKLTAELLQEKSRQSGEGSPKDNEKALYRALTTGITDNKDLQNATRDRCFYSAVFNFTTESLFGQGQNMDGVYMTIRAMFSRGGWQNIPSVAPEKRCVFALLLTPPDFIPGKNPEPMRTLENIQLKLAQDGMDCCIGLSGPWQGISKLKQSYDASRIAAERGFYEGIGNIYMASEVKSTGTPATYEDERKFLAGMRAHKSQDARAALHHMFATMSERRTSKTACILVLAHLYVNLIELLHAQPGVDALTSKEFSQQLEEQDTFKDLCDYAEGCYMSMVSVRNSEHSSAHGIVLDAIAYVEKNSAKPISVNEVADYLNLSVSYFSTVFRRETGEKFIAYIIRYKIEKACAMLEAGSDKIYEIGSSLGYTDVKYFCKLFRKYTGCTPSEYRESRQREKR